MGLPHMSDYASWGPSFMASTVVPLIIILETYLSYFLVTLNLNTLNCSNLLIRYLNTYMAASDDKLVLTCSDQTKEAKL